MCCRILNSRLFKFIVGEQADGQPTEFLVHEDAIAQLSKPLELLTKGDDSARWSDVSKETFERFAQYAYTGDYSIPKIEKRATAIALQKVPSSSSSAPNGVKPVDFPESDGAPTFEENGKQNNDIDLLWSLTN